VILLFVLLATGAVFEQDAALEDVQIPRRPTSPKRHDGKT
jgi:hypothetical protein